MTPLHWAAQNGKLEAVAILLAVPNIQVDARTKLRETPLHFASGNGCLKIVQMLVDRGADVNAHDIEGRTPIHAAVAEKRFDCVDHLLNVPGLKLTVRDCDGVCFLVVVHLLISLRRVHGFSHSFLSYTTRLE
jgi:ankyrin repeat protein